jgi:putative NIF3 family GTP cyclohydrolase 1 type 2
MAKINELVNYTGQILQVERFSDNCPNGLQAEGRLEIKKIVSGVTASILPLGKHLAQHFDLEHSFIDMDNPV